MTWASIESSRLSLRSLGRLELEALLLGDRSTCGRLLGCVIGDELPLDRMPLAMRLKQIHADGAVQPWLLRAIVEHDSRRMIGHIGFHSAPRAGYLETIAPDGVELGYSVDASFRRRGYATEAALSLMKWAYQTHSQRCFVLSISPQNIASTAMAQKLAFEQCGSHMDERDGLEIEFVKRIETWPAEWRMLLGE